jgi:hypothetical protein
MVPFCSLEIAFHVTRELSSEVIIIIILLVEDFSHTIGDLKAVREEKRPFKV